MSMTNVIERNQKLVALFSEKHYKRAFCPVSTKDLKALLGYAESWNRIYEVLQETEERAYQLVADDKLTVEEMIALVTGGDEFRVVTTQLGYEIWLSRKEFESLPAPSAEDLDIFRAKVAELEEQMEQDTRVV